MICPHCHRCTACGQPERRKEIELKSPEITWYYPETIGAYSEEIASWSTQERSCKCQRPNL